MTLPASIRVNVRAPFPTQVKGAAFVTVNKANGVWTISPNYALLAASAAIKQTQIVALQDTQTGIWSYVSMLSAAAAAFNAYRIVTLVGAVSVLPTDVVLLLQKDPSGPSTIDLPVSATRAGAPVIIKDLTGDANTNNITIVPAAGETIDGFSAAAAAANGVAVISTDYGSKRLYPLNTGGWYAL